MEIAPNLDQFLSDLMDELGEDDSVSLTLNLDVNDDDRLFEKLSDLHSLREYEDDRVVDLEYSSSIMGGDITLNIKDNDVTF